MGGFVTLNRPIARVAFSSPDGTPEDAHQVVNRAVVLGADRSFHMDPRFGLTTLAEIASRALSPGINDPGTAIDVIKRLIRILIADLSGQPAPAPQHHTLDG